jgi:hypothetical protein
MKKIAIVFASAGLMALAACGEKPATETNASNEVVENVIDNAANVAENAADVAANAANVAENAANAH